MTGHKLTEAYKARMDRFAVVFPTAHAFLERIENTGPSQGMWLSTATNAHLYKADAFLAYLKLRNPELKPPSLVVSPRFNQQIAAHTTDRSALLFPAAFDEVLAQYDGRSAGWAARHAGGGTELTVATPATFFDSLYEVLSALRM